MANRFNLSICLDDIPDGFQRWAKEAKNGKTYFNATCVEMKQAGKFGDTHFVKVSWKNDKGEWEDKIIGNLKPLENKTASNATPPQVPKANNDLPF